MNRNIALILPLLFLPIPTLALGDSANSSSSASDTQYCQQKMSYANGESFSEKQQQNIASQITVRVKGDNNGGSGTLLAKQGNSYLVITNAHVVRGVNSLHLQTADHKTYPAEIVSKINLDKFDLALLKFQSNQNYCVPEIAPAIPDAGPVLAAGFSVEIGEIVFRAGEIKRRSDRPLKEGYQIGYSSNIEQGMSGGAIINNQGILIGINGKSAYPILNTGYVYQDGSRPTEEEIKQMRTLSWEIPVSTFLASVKPEILTAYTLPSPATPPSIPQAQLTGWLGELEKKAKQITVRIDSSSQANGSGIIIAKVGNTYTVLTASHVVCERENATQPCGNNSYQILAPDGKQYPVDKSSIKKEEGVDLAVVKFTASNQNYQVATLANYYPSDKDYMFTGGYPKLGDKSPWRFTAGQISEKELGLLRISLSVSHNGSAGTLQTGNSLTGGYELVYTSIAYGGMSGGPVLDSQGRVIGIHGLAEAEQAQDEKRGDLGSNNEGQVQIGYRLGIPVSTFLGLTQRLGVIPQHVEKTPPISLNKQQAKSIEQALLSASVANGNVTASQWLERGNQLWGLRRYEEAVEDFERAIQIKPSFVYLAYYGKGLALGELGKEKEAIAAFVQAVKEKPDYAAAWAKQSFYYRKLNQFESALVAIEKAIKLQPNNPNLYNEKSWVLEDLQRYPEAEAAITKATTLRPRAAFFTTGGNIYTDQRKWDLALKYFNHAIALNPNYAYAYMSLGIFYAHQGKWDVAEADFNHAIALNPKDANVYIVRTLLYAYQNKPDLEIADLNKVIALNPKEANAYIGRGDSYILQKKWDLALADFNQAIALNPKDSRAYSERGFLYILQKKWDLALVDFNHAIALNPKNASAYSSRGDLYILQKKRDLALADFNQAIALNPNDSSFYSSRGNLYSEQKKWDLALADFNQAITLYPNLAVGYDNRAILYKRQKKWDLALADYNKEIALNPKDSSAYSRRGNLYTEQKKWDLALADFNQAIAFNPKDANAYSSRGDFYKEQKKWDLALADFNQAIALDSTDVVAYVNRGLLYSEQKKWDLALADFNRAIALNVNAYNILGNLYNIRGNLYIQQKKWDLALADFNRAIALDRTDVVAYFNRGNLYQQQKKWDLALADFNKAIALNPNVAFLYNTRALLYQQQKKWDLALADLNKGIDINPQDAIAYTNRGIIYQEQKKWDLALTDFNKAIDINPTEANTYINWGLIKYEQGEIDAAIGKWQQATKLNSKLAEPHLALAVALYGKGEQEKAYQLAETALRLDKTFADVTVLKKNLWGERLIRDAQKLLSSSQIQTLLSQLH